MTAVEVFASYAPTHRHACPCSNAGTTGYCWDAERDAEVAFWLLAEAPTSHRKNEVSA